MNNLVYGDVLNRSFDLKHNNSFKDIENYYYNERLSYNNMIYSIDMIRLKTNITYNKFYELEFRLQTVWGNFVEKKYTSCQISQFFYNYVIKDNNSNTFWFGFLHNSENRKENEEVYYNLTIEFNPNKIKSNNIVNYILNLSGEWYIKSYDIAIDLKINILDLIIDKGLKKQVKIFSNGFDNKTYEIGKGDKRVKIYNKKIEGNYDINYDLTRIEISRQLNDFNITDIKYYKYKIEDFPEIYTNNFICSLSEYNDKTLYAIIFAVQNGFPLNELSRVYKNKVKKLFEGGQKLKFVCSDVENVLRKTIFCYFMNNIKIKWK